MYQCTKLIVNTLTFGKLITIRNKNTIYTTNLKLQMRRKEK